MKGAPLVLLAWAALLAVHTTVLIDRKSVV